MITMMNLVFPLIIILVSAGIVFSKAEERKKAKPAIKLSHVYLNEAKDEEHVFSIFGKIVYQALAFIPITENSSQYTVSFEVKHKNKFESICDVSLANQDDLNCEHGCYYEKLAPFYIFILNSTVKSLLDKTKIRAVIIKDMAGEVAHSQDWDILIPSEKATEHFIFLYDYYVLEDEGLEIIFYEALSFIPMTEYSPQYTFSFQVKHENSTKFESICDISLADESGGNSKQTCFYEKIGPIYYFTLLNTVHPLLDKTKIQAVIKKHTSGEVVHIQNLDIFEPSVLETCKLEPESEITTRSSVIDHTASFDSYDYNIIGKKNALCIASRIKIKKSQRQTRREHIRMDSLNK